MLLNKKFFNRILPIIVLHTKSTIISEEGWKMRENEKNSNRVSNNRNTSEKNENRNEKSGKNQKNQRNENRQKNCDEKSR